MKKIIGDNDKGNAEHACSKGDSRFNIKRKWSYVLILFACLLILLVVVFVGTALYVWLEEAITKNSGAMEDAIAEVGNEEVVEEIDTLTRAEADAEILAAVETAMQTASEEEQKRILDGIAEQLTSGKSFVESIRPFYPDDIVLVSGGQFHFVPIKENLKKNSYSSENLTILENGRFEYSENGQVISHLGIDVSKYQGSIDWEKVAADGVEFAYIRVGLRGYGTGEIVEDEQFEENIKGALKAGIQVGVYFFSQAISEAEAVEEAMFVLDKITPYNVQCPVVLDVENVAGSEARMNALTVEERTKVSLAFIHTIEQSGYTPMLYHNMEMASVLLDLESFEGYEKWFAFYGTDFYYPYDYGVWQYSEKGKVDGINAEVDLNIAFSMWE